MTLDLRFALGMPGLLLALTDCGGRGKASEPAPDGAVERDGALSSEAGAEAGADAGADGADADAEASAPVGPCSGTGTGAPPGVPPSHRTASDMCPPGLYGPSFPDAGPCSTDAECLKATHLAHVFCVHGACTQNQCYSDSDCAPGTACECGAQFAPGTYGANGCLPAQCRLDADCGPGRYCVASTSGYCAYLAGLYCTSPEDTCVDPQTDCPCPSDAGPPSTTHSVCEYLPTVGHFVCATATCNG